MRQIAIFLVIILDIVFGENIDLNLPGRKFYNGANNVEAPALELNVPMDQLKGTTINTIGLYIDQIVNQLNIQANVVSEQLQNKVQRASRSLYNATQSVNYNNKHTILLEDKLREMTTVLQEFLDLLPGNELRNRLIYDFSDGEEIVLPNNCPRTAKDLFLNLEDVLNSDMSQLHQFIYALYTEGWRSMRFSLYRIQDQFREQLLNGIVLETYRDTVLFVYLNISTIKLHVKESVWNEFNESAKLIEKIYNDVKRAKSLEI